MSLKTLYNTKLAGHNGVLFMDEHFELYSDNLGNVLKHLNFGLLTAGQTSLPTPIWLKNELGFPVEHIKIWCKPLDIDTKNIKITYSLSSAPFEAEDVLHINGIICNGENFKFYTRIETSLNTLQGGTFDTYIEAEPA